MQDLSNKQVSLQLTVNIDVWIGKAIQTSPVAYGDKVNMKYGTLHQASHQYAAEHTEIYQFICYIKLASSPYCKLDMYAWSIAYVSLHTWMHADAKELAQAFSVLWFVLAGPLWRPATVWAVKCPFGELPNIQKITSSPTGRVKESEDFTLVTF